MIFLMDQICQLIYNVRYIHSACWQARRQLTHDAEPMYSHLLVPTDGTALSAANVRSAVDLAAAFGARITFLHAVADFAATSDGAVLHTIDPALFEQQALGDTYVVLAKAVASARAAGVPSSALSCTSSRPAEAIVQAATQQACDLIVMASRGTRGIENWWSGSQTERVLRKAPTALLVTRVEASVPLLDDERALAVIYDEHRSIAATMQCLTELTSQAEPLDVLACEQVRLLVGYLREFPQRLHHPKEEEYLHRLLRQRFPDCEEHLAELEAQHDREEQLLTAVERALTMADDAVLRAAIGTLVQAIGDHLGCEERTVFPLARAHLQPQDWAEIATAFEANGDTRFNSLTTTEFGALFRRIANLTMAQSQRQA